MTNASGGGPPRWVFILPLALFAIMAAGNPLISVPEVAPLGILNHQSAGSAATVEAIHQAWQAKGAWGYAQGLIGLDLVFIPAALAGFLAGAIGLWGRGLRALSVAAGVGGVLAFGTDLTETVAQAWQVFVVGPDDGLARLAASMGEAKLAGYGVALGALLAGLALLRLKK